MSNTTCQIPFEVPEDVKVSSALFDCGQSETLLWHLTRAVDRHGAGWANITPKQAAAILGVSQNTIYRWLKNSAWFRGYDRKSGRIYYVSIEKVACHVGNEQLGAISLVPLSTLTRSKSKLVATQLDAQHGQNRARYKIFLARRKTKKSQRPTRQLEPFQPSENLPGALLDTFSYFVVDANSVVPAISTDKIAKHRRWSTQTIRKRLRNGTRTSKGLPTLKRVRLLTPAPPEVAFEMRESGKSFLAKGDRVYKTLSSNGQTYILGCHHYEEPYKLLNCSHLRARVNKAFRLFNEPKMLFDGNQVDLAVSSQPD
jgi:hypothetical protein